MAAGKQMCEQQLSQQPWESWRPGWRGKASQSPRHPVEWPKGSVSTENTWIRGDSQAKKGSDWKPFWRWVPSRRPCWLHLARWLLSRRPPLQEMEAIPQKEPKRGSAPLGREPLQAEGPTSRVLSGSYRMLPTTGLLPFCQPAFISRQETKTLFWRLRGSRRKGSRHGHHGGPGDHSSTAPATRPHPRASNQPFITSLSSIWAAGHRAPDI